MDLNPGNRSLALLSSGEDFRLLGKRDYHKWVYIAACFLPEFMDRKNQQSYLHWSSCEIKPSTLHLIAHAHSLKHKEFGKSMEILKELKAVIECLFLPSA